jgi:ribosomal-protein-alanine N-acetyltransferase
MLISLELMSKENSIDIYFFEKENRKYFEQNLLPRPADYFNSESFKELQMNC